MECECLSETEGRGDGRASLGTSVALTHSPLSSHRLSLQQEQWMNVRVGDIIKLENNQFVAVRDQPPRTPAGASFSLAQRDECHLAPMPLEVTFPEWAAVCHRDA